MGSRPSDPSPGWRDQAMGLARRQDGATAPPAATTRARRPRRPKVIKLGSDFAGLGPASVAMRRMGVPFTNVFASDTAKPCQKIITAVHNPGKLFTDISKRTPGEEQDVDVYTFTPPCQDFSQNGLRRGVNGPKQTGALIKKAMQYIKNKTPRVTIFENVFAMTHKTLKPVLDGIVKALINMGYTVNYKVLDSRDYGLPQDRRRVFVVAIRTDAIKHAFNWPQATKPCPSINAILDPWKPTDKAGRLPTIERQMDLCKTAYKECFDCGRDPRSTPILVDIDASPKFATYGIDEAKTITRSRGGDGGPWISTRGRRTTPTELIKLQGFQLIDVPWTTLKISQRQVGQLIGNAVSVNTMGAILEEALWSSGLVDKKVAFPRGVKHPPGPPPQKPQAFFSFLPNSED